MLPSDPPPIEGEGELTNRIGLCIAFNAMIPKILNSFFTALVAARGTDSRPTAPDHAGPSMAIW